MGDEKELSSRGYLSLGIGYSLKAGEGIVLLSKLTDFQKLKLFLNCHSAHLFNLIMLKFYQNLQCCVHKCIFLALWHQIAVKLPEMLFIAQIRTFPSKFIH